MMVKQLPVLVCFLELPKILRVTVYGINVADVKEIILPNSIEIIGSSAFRGCKMLERMEIPSGVKEIWSDSFDGCKKLSEIYIPESVQIMGTDVFGGCDGLTVYVPFRKGELPEGWNKDWSRTRSIGVETGAVLNIVYASE